MLEKQPAVDGGKWVDQGLHIGMAHLLLAPCVVKCENILYDNPITDPPCFCSDGHCPLKLYQRSNTCTCSGCVPELPLPPLPRATQSLRTIPMELRLTDKMTDQGTERLREFRQQVWMEKWSSIGFVVPVAVLPDANIKNILDNFARIQNVEQLQPYIDGLFVLSGSENRLLALILELRTLFLTMPQPEAKKNSGRKQAKAVPEM